MTLEEIKIGTQFIYTGKNVWKSHTNIPQIVTKIEDDIVYTDLYDSDLKSKFYFSTKSFYKEFCRVINPPQ